VGCYDAEPNGSIRMSCTVTNHAKVQTRYLSLKWVFYAHLVHICVHLVHICVHLVHINAHELVDCVFGTWKYAS